MDEETFKRILNETQNYLAPGGVVLVRNLRDILSRDLIPEGFDAEPAGLSPEGVFWQPQSSSMVFRLVRSHAVKGRSLGAVLSDAELSVAASELGFGVFEGTDVERKEAFNKFLSNLKPEAVEKIGGELRQHISQEIIPRIFQSEEDSLKLLVRSKRLLSQEALNRQVRRIVESLGREISALNEDAQAELGRLFVSVLQGASLDIILEKIEAEKEVQKAAQVLYRENTQTTDQETFMKKAIEKLNADLAAKTDALKNPENKTVIAADLASFPKTNQEVKGVLERAFRAAAKDDMGPRLGVFIYYTAAEIGHAQGVKDYLAALRKTEPLLASKIQLKRKTLKTLEDALRDHRKTQKPNENLIFMVPDLARVAAVKNSPILLHRDSEIPKDLSFVKGILSEVAVGLAAVLKLREDDPKRTEYLNYLKDNLGMSVAKDAERQQWIIGFNLRALVEKLVSLQKQEQAIRVAA
jgi:hypothetical protein